LVSKCTRMELIELRHRITSAFVGSKKELQKVLDLVDQDRSIFPFNEYEHLICHLMHAGGLTFANYLELRSDYVNANPNLWIFEISAPRGFGERVAQTLVMAKCNALKKPTKTLDSKYGGEYDLWLEGTKIEVKASRAVDSDSDEPLYMKALARRTKRPFLMNFQQLKPQCCDVFVWVAVFRDEVVFWVIPSKAVAKHKLFSKGQHRGNHGNEGQMHITQENIDQLAQFELKDRDLGKAIRKAAKG
jgi:hypothetical protein